MKTYNIAICISLLLASFSFAKNALPIINDINQAPPELQIWMKNNPPTVKPEHLELIVTTDKHQYLLGEPVTLTVAVRNITDKDIELDYPLGFFSSTTIDVFKPSDVEQKTGSNEIKSTATLKKAKDRRHFYTDDGDRYKIPSKGILAFSRILNNWYDLTHPNGKYTVTINHRIAQNLQFVFTMNATLSFEILPQVADINKITAENMVSVFGKKKTLELLGEEATKILANMERDKLEGIAMSNEYERLMMILRTIEAGTLIDCNHRLKSLEENNKMTINDLRELIRQVCKYSDL